LLSSNISSTCPHNMVNFGPLAAEIVSLVWGTPANFNGFRFLAALLQGTVVVGVSQTLRRWTEGATMFGRAAISWSLAHVLAFILICRIWKTRTCLCRSHCIWLHEFIMCVLSFEMNLCVAHKSACCAFLLSVISVVLSGLNCAL